MLLAVQLGQAKRTCMKTFALLLLAAIPAKQNAPLPFTPQQQSEIGCIAVLGLLAYDQGRGLSLDYPDVRVRGKKWAGVTGDRIAFESKQDAEVVAYAIKLAVKSEQDAVITAADSKARSTSRIDACLAMMEGDVACQGEIANADFVSSLVIARSVATKQMHLSR